MGPIFRELPGSQWRDGRAVNYRAIGSKHRAVARTIPGLVGIIPGYGTAHMRAGCRQCMQRSVRGLAHGDFALAELDHTGRARLDVLEACYEGLAVPALIEILWRPTRRVIQLRPWI